jgi:hypothetical protein
LSICCRHLLSLFPGGISLWHPLWWHTDWLQIYGPPKCVVVSIICLSPGGDHTSETCMHACMHASNFSFNLVREPSIHKPELLHPSIHYSTSLRWPACNILTTQHHINRAAHNLSVPSKYYYTTGIWTLRGPSPPFFRARTYNDQILLHMAPPKCQGFSVFLLTFFSHVQIQLIGRTTDDIRHKIIH